MSIAVESARRAALGAAGAGVLAGAMFFTALPSAPEASAAPPAPAVVNTAGLPMHTVPMPQHWHHHHWWWHHWWWWW